MTDAPQRMTVRYGRINREMMARWMGRAPDQDGPFWALNLMKYRDIADYGGGGADAPSGREADDAYTPRDALAGIGAEIAFVADVDRVLAGDGTAWDRVAIVRYPARKKFLEMQQRDDFRKQHVHKDAGMEFTIVMSCLPRLPFRGQPERHPFVELRVTREDARGESDAAVFDVEGVIVGDERTWSAASFRWLDMAPAAAAAPAGDVGTYVMLLRPTIDRLTRSVLEAAG
jgi:hypothetical protein